MATIKLDAVTFQENELSKSLGQFLEEKGVNCSVYITCNGKLVQTSDTFEDGRIYHIIPRVFGGKGGFGSMLRSIGAQIEKTTNREACRDLSGRRMRDVNNEQQLRDWVAKKAARERERENRRKERAERRRQALTDHRHNFDDPDYHSQKMQVLERLDEALRQGLVSKKGSSSDAAEASASASPVGGASSCQPGASGVKRKATNGGDQNGDADTKRACDWLGIDVNDLSGLDSDSGESSGSQSDTEATSQGTDSEMDVQAAANDGKTDKSESAEKTTLTDGKNSTEVQEIGHQDKVTDHCTEARSQLQTDEQKGEKKGGLLEKLKEIPPSEDKQETQGPVNLDDYTSAAELESIGLDTLKNELMSKGLKCGGTLQQRAERLWAVKGKSKEEIDPSFFAKPTRQKKK